MDREVLGYTYQMQTGQVHCGTDNEYLKMKYCHDFRYDRYSTQKVTNLLLIIFLCSYSSIVAVKASMKPGFKAVAMENIHPMGIPEQDK